MVAVKFRSGGGAGCATAAEVDRGLKLLEKVKSEHGANAARALELFCLTVLNQNEFVFLD